MDGDMAGRIADRQQGMHDQWMEDQNELMRLSARITALEAENAKLREALVPFAEVAKHDISLSEHSDDIFRPMFKHNHAPILRIGHFRDAAATLTQIDKPKDTK